jgi:NAD(P)-dependent dehydrogenase (short-subunit alcohol dehydrogenase family)
MPAVELFDLTGQTAVVTGGNSGLGFGYATGLAKCGSDVWIFSRRAKENSAAVDALSVHGTNIRALEVDVSDENNVVAAMAEAVATSGRVDTVVSNAGFLRMKSLHEMTADNYHKQLSVNQHGGFYTIREAVRHMKARADAGDPGGSIIITGSLSTMFGDRGTAHYGAAKAALSALMMSVAVEYGRDGIRCNVVAPGLIYTGAFGGTPEEDLPVTAVIRGRQPIPRLGYPSDFEGIAAYLASPASAFQTGSITIIDGGYSRVGLM